MIKKSNTIKKKKKPWVSKKYDRRGKIVWLFCFLYAKIKYGFHYKLFKDTKKRGYLILYNHQTSWDEFFIGLNFKRNVYLVATEDIFNLGLATKIIQWFANPIPIRKSISDLKAVKICMKVAKEGGSLGIAPEGNRTYSGETCNIQPAIAKLAKKLQMPIILYNIRGGYGVRPRWSNDIRRGRIDGVINRIIEPEEYNSMSESDLLLAIREGLYIDESYREVAVKSKRLAEHLERMVYVCPICGLSEFASDGAAIKCTHCGFTLKYTAHNTFEGEKPVFKNVKEWYHYQEDFINKLDVNKLDGVIYSDEAKLREVILYKRKNVLFKQMHFELYNNRYVIKHADEKIELNFDDIIVTSVLGKNKMQIYCNNDKVYQVSGGNSFNALKYVNIYFRYKNLKEGNTNNDNSSNFLGL
ncbi:MAG: lysophospholipid acyltransferase family protein [Bacilli bacterium]